MDDEKLGLDPGAALATFLKSVSDAGLTGDEVGQIFDDLTHTGLVDAIDDVAWQAAGNKLVAVLDTDSDGDFDFDDIKAIGNRKPEGLRKAAAAKRETADRLLNDGKARNDNRGSRLLRRAEELERLAKAREEAAVATE